MRTFTRSAPFGAPPFWFPFGLLTAVLTVSLGGASCIPDVGVDDTAVLLSCSSDSECPEAFACKQTAAGGRCISAAVLAKTPISLVAPLALTSDRARFSPAPGFEHIEVAFTLSEAPHALAVTLGDEAFRCDAPDSVRFVCSYDVSAETAPGPRTVRLRATDAAENVVDDDLDLVVDATAPGFVRATAVIGAPDGLLAHPVAATVGSTVTVDVVLDEALAAVPEAVALVPGNEACVDVVVSASATTLTCRAVIADATASSRAIAFDARDDVGNSAHVEAALDVAFDFDAPAAPDVDTAGALTYERAPWGDKNVASPHFTLVVGAALTDGDALAVFGDEDGAQLLAVSTLAPAVGTRLDLGAEDHAIVYVAAVDGAGARSPLVAVRDQDFIASLGGKRGTQTFVNPHRVFAGSHPDRLELTRTSLFVDDETELADPTPLAPGNADAAVVHVRPAWTEQDSTTAPAARTSFCLAFDAARGEVVLFGGVDDNGDARDETWVFANGSWRVLLPRSHPPALRAPACAYDPVRDVVVLAGGRFEGGSGGANSDAVWQWDGENWSQFGTVDGIVAADDLAAHGADVAADFIDDAVVFAGFADDVTVVVDDDVRGLAIASPVGLTPSLVTGVWIAGTESQKFANGVWSARPSLPRSAGDGPAYPEVGVVVIAPDDIDDADGVLVLQDQWRERPALPVGDRSGAGAVAADGGSVLLFGGASVDGPLTVVLDATNASSVRAVTAPPAATSAIAQLAFTPGDADEAAGLLGLTSDNTVLHITELGVTALGSALGGVLVDGAVGDVGSVGSVGSVEDDERAALIADGGLLLLFAPDGAGELFAQRIVNNDAVLAAPGGGSVAGGRGARLGNDRAIVTGNGATFVLSRDVWREVPSGPVPAAGFGFGVVDGAFVLYPDAVGHTWRLADDTWTDLGLIGPGARTGVACASESARGDRVVCFGGFVDGVVTNELWAFADGAWTRIEASAGPGPRAGGALGYDRSRGSFVAVGGVFSNNEVWRFRSGARDRADMRFAIDVGVAGLDDAALTAVAVDVVPTPEATVFWHSDGFWTTPGSLVGRDPTLHVNVIGDDVLVVDDLTATLHFRSAP